VRLNAKGNEQQVGLKRPKKLQEKADQKAMEAIRQRQLADQQKVEAIAARNAEQVARKEETRQRQKAQQQASLALKQSQVAQQQRSLAEQEKARAEKALQQAELQTRRADEEARKAADATLRLDAFKFLSAWEPLYLAPNSEDGFTAIGLNHFVQGDELATGKIVIDGSVVDWRKGLTKQQAMSLLSQDLRSKAKEIDALVKVDINSNQRLALLAFVYNLGINSLKGSSLLEKINASRFDEVPAAFMKWVNPGSPIEPSLRRRRQAEVDLWNTPP
jgi:lysozyme